MIYLTEDEINAVIFDTDLDNPGICLQCGKRAEGVEPDARAYRCDHCGKRSVYGIEEAVLMGAVSIAPEERFAGIVPDEVAPDAHLADYGDHYEAD